jgi:hypothetical protein
MPPYYYPSYDYIKPPYFSSTAFKTSFACNVKERVSFSRLLAGFYLPLLRPEREKNVAISSFWCYYNKAQI